jgi:hypothetical protein
MRNGDFEQKLENIEIMLSTKNIVDFDRYYVIWVIISTALDENLWIN